MKRPSAYALALLVSLTAFASSISPYDPAAQHSEYANAPPGRSFLLGTDEYGRDVLSRLLHAGRWSLLAASLATALSLGCGTLLGLAAAGSPKAIESGLLWLADLSMSLPWLYLLFAVRGTMPLSLAPEQAFLAVIVLAGLAGWAIPARLVRSASIGILAMDYVAAARAFGASRLHIWFRHVLPSLGPVLAPQVFILMPRYVLAESALSFLGLGLGEPTPTWGSMLASARNSLAGGLNWWLLSPLAPMLWLTVASGQLAERRGDA